MFDVKISSLTPTFESNLKILSNSCSLFYILRFMTPIFSKLNFPSFDKIFDTGKFEEKFHIVHWVHRQDL